ncbi:hypothetical protein KA005_69015 [bacterium]|nr:hypothetical protein [bacterium]
MRHILQAIMPYHLENMIVVVEIDPKIDNPRRCLWFLYNAGGELVRSGYGGWCPDIRALQSAFRNAKQAARRYIHKTHPLFFG